MNKLKKVMELLIAGKQLNVIHRDHQLQGAWKDYRDCHVEGDWVLIYQLGENEDGEETITFHATDNHAHLFQ